MKAHVKKERTCFMTRIRASTELMIRFVVDPYGYVVADLKGNLPGRGAWLSMSRDVVEKAVKKGAFSRTLKREVQVTTDLADNVEHLLIRAALGSLAMARKSGHIITGASKVDAALRNGHICMVLHANEATDNGKRRIAHAIRVAKNQGHEAISVLTLFTVDEMAHVFGSKSVVIHAAICKGLAIDGFIRKARQLVVYRNENMMNWKVYGKTVKGTE